ncbi:exodeoxyribonuclease VII large subunit [Alteromonas sp. ASW11-19]|uniref:Exodeoxyribonuclease 7 large subunit n=1 Tax=Alteromonas salexigens TaxID=2982530 RepID=A0ABT2VRC9_9ALTE|nr:exodeoxyribonuclease VII large subunit [Alteromonas salexigens]MCU7555690.1 exodeoxyribonuclease VII large subunit [Alteromonas salexigens]
MISTSPGSTRQILSVTRLNRLARTILESEIGLVWLSAEVSNFVSAASGHWYFTLKDNKAQVRAAMFRNANRTVRNRPKEGDKILVRASVGLYEPRGDYQLVVEHMESDGEGRLKQAFDALKMKLHGEGLFDSTRKQPLPEHIRRIGVITSPSGAALHDVLSVLARRSPATEVIVYPSMVQGETAPAQLINAIHTANARNEVDVILLTRGGGSLEDLWCFNDETLARTIANSSLPIVSAVGHEVDVTIADFVADMRAPTPSAAAEQLSQDLGGVVQQLMQYRQRLIRAWQRHSDNARHTLRNQQQRLTVQHPVTRIQYQSQTLDRMQAALVQSMQRRINQAGQHSAVLASRLRQQDPARMIRRQQERCADLTHRNARAMQLRLQHAKAGLSQQMHLLNSVSPLSTLSRGYSITLQDDKAVTDVTSLNKGDTLRTRVKNGEIISVVKSTEATKNPSS